MFVVLGVRWKVWKVRNCFIFLSITYKRTSSDVVKMEEYSIFSGINVASLRTVTAAFRYIAGGSCLPSARCVV